MLRILDFMVTPKSKMPWSHVYVKITVDTVETGLDGSKTGIRGTDQEVIPVIL